MTQRTIPKQRFKMLVDTTTNQVVWLTYLLKVSPPIIDPCLNYTSYGGHPNLDVYKEFLQFKLFFNSTTKELTVDEQPFKNKQEEERIRYLRYKCQAFDILSSLFAIYDERMDLPTTAYLGSIDSSMRTDWISVYEETFNCSRANAEKLLDFKIHEYKRSKFMLESTKLKMAEDLKNAKNIDEVKFIYDTTSIKIFNLSGMGIFE